MKKKNIEKIMQQFEELKASIEAAKLAAPQEVFLDSSQMMALMRCSESKLYRLRSKGILPCIKIGGQYRYPQNYFTREVLERIGKKEDPSKRFDD